MSDPFSELHAGNEENAQSEFWGEWTEEDARRVQAGGREEGRWGECWQWPVVESVSDRILESYQGRWAGAGGGSLYNDPSLLSYNRYSLPPNLNLGTNDANNSPQLLSHKRHLDLRLLPPTRPPPPTPLNRQQPSAPPNTSTSHHNPYLGPSLLQRFPPQTRPNCGFCRGNGECLDVYSSHSLRSSTGTVSCPYLRGHVCEICGATGDQAHTRSYCPENPGARALPPLLKRTARQSDGRYRRHRRQGNN